jgi:hypothetical protein
VKFVGTVRMALKKVLAVDKGL